MTASLTERAGTRRWITDDDVRPLQGTATIGSGAVLADPLKVTRERRLPVIPRVWEDVGEPAWVKPTAQAMDELLALEPDWDSYGALTVDPWHVYTMLQVLALVMRDDTPVPSVCPTNRGGVQVEWHERGIDLEIETLSTYTLGVSFEDSLTGTEWDREVDADLSPLINCIAELSSR